MDTDTTKDFIINSSIVKEVESLKVQLQPVQSCSQLIVGLELFERLINQGWTKRSTPQIVACKERTLLKIDGELIILEEERVYTELSLE